MNRGRTLLAAAAALAALVAMPLPASSNGRFPSSTSVHVRPGNDDALYLGVTFGLLVSPDDGGHWYWTCEENVGYAGTFDPKYAVAPDGTVYATTYDGLRVSEDGGCSFRTATQGGTDELVGIWVDAIDIAPDGTVWFGTAETGLSNAVYRTTDKGRTVEMMGLQTKTAWWKSLRIAPSNPQRIYVTGYQVAPTAEIFVQRSDDGGETWNPMPTTDLVVGSEPLVLLEGVDPTDPDILYVRSVKVTNPSGDRLYRSDDGGLTWTGVLDTDRTLRAVAVRGDGEVIAGTVASSADPVAGCTYRSSARGTAFTACELGPQMACLVERGDGDLFACGGNWDPDFFTLGRSTDAASWTPVVRFHEMTGPIDCPQGTTGYDVCTLQLWPGIQEQFGVPVPDAGPVDPPPPPPNGCCDAGGDGDAPVLLALGVAALLVRRRRRACGR